MTPDHIQPKGLLVDVERHVFVRPDGSAEDILTVTFTNVGSCEISLDCGLSFRYRDSATEFLAARDFDGTWIPPVEDRLKDHDEVLVAVHGGVQVNDRRSVAVKVMRHDLVRVVDDALHLADPLYALSMPDITAQKIRFRATIVFPESPYRRRLVADGARVVTSRTAEWDWGAGSGASGNLHIRVHQAPAALVGAPRKIDDAIAEVCGLRASSVMGDWPDMSTLRGLLSHPAIGSAARLSLPTEEDFVELPHRQRDAYLGDLLARLRTARSAFLAGCEFNADADVDVLTRAERIYRALVVEMQQGEPTQPPDDVGEALLHLLQYQSTQRAKPTKWAPVLDEAVFQERIEEFLAARNAGPGREVRLGGGRCDFLLSKTPVELKVANFGGRPEAELPKHLNQAAEYAASLGSPVAVLLVLDEFRYPNSGSYLPAPDSQVRVDTVESEPGSAGRTRTIVISIIIPAYPPKPSRMGGANARRPA